MRWHWEDMTKNELVLDSFTTDERSRAETGIADLRLRGGEHGKTTGSRLHLALVTQRLPWDVLKSLSSWCNTEGKYGPGVVPAKTISRAFFNGRVLPRLTPFRHFRLTDEMAHGIFDDFAESAGVWSDQGVSLDENQQDSAALDRMIPSLNTPPTITYKQKPIADFASLISAYGKNEFASPFRSTIPLLAYWSPLEIRISDFCRQLGLEIANVEEFGFEYTVPPQSGTGTASHTDLMVFMSNCTIAIEAKYTESPYKNVRDWLTPPSTNRKAVLNGWLALINRATGATLAIEDVLDSTYQLIHRTASVCKSDKPRKIVIYQLFDVNDAQALEYNAQISHLNTLIDRPSHIGFYVHATTMQKSPMYQQLQVAWYAGNRDLSNEVSHGLISRTLIDFGDSVIYQA